VDWIAQLLLLCTCVGWGTISLHFCWLDGRIDFYGLDSPVAFSCGQLKSNLEASIFFGLGSAKAYSLYCPRLENPFCQSLLLDSSMDHQACYHLGEVACVNPLQLLTFQVSKHVS